MADKKLLMIDDDRALGEMLKLKIEKSGDYAVTYSPDGHRIVELALEVKPDLVILDIDMPGTDGGDARTALQNNPATEGIAVLFLSSLVTLEDVAESGGVISGHQMASKQSTVGELVERIQALL
jgi:DNA-binding response OmpR family regulator